MKKCKQGYEVKPMKSACGWYLGTVDADGFPNCRVSTEYAKTAEEAAKVLIPDRQMQENAFCNGGCGCMITEVTE